MHYFYGQTNLMAHFVGNQPHHIWRSIIYEEVLKLAASYHPKLDGFNKIYLIRKLVKYKRGNNQLKY